MSIRTCAMESEAFLALKEVYDYRETHAAQWRAQGKKVVAQLGCDVPDELVIAAGMLPVRVYADPEKPLTETGKYLEYAFDPMVRAQFERIVDGTCHSQADYLAISNSTDVLIRVFLYLRELEKTVHTALVRQVTEDAKAWPVLDGFRVFYTGANQEDTVLYDKIEAAGMVVVGEDTDWGDRHYDRDYNPAYPVIRGIVDRYMLREFSARKALVSQRVEALDRQVDAAGAQGVIFYTSQYDEVATWDMPNQRRSLTARGIRHITFGRMLWPVIQNENLDEKLAGFVAEMKGVSSNV